MVFEHILKTILSFLCLIRNFVTLKFKLSLITGLRLLAKFIDKVLAYHDFIFFLEFITNLSVIFHNMIVIHTSFFF